MRNIKMTIAFDGSKYKGWQKLKDSDLTIQGKIEAVLSKMTEEEVLLVGCGKVDAGAHAENYVANFHTKCTFSTEKMLEYCYEYLPEDIVVKSMEVAEERFHARYNVKSETYVYTINNQKYRDVFNRKYAYHLAGKLKLRDMRKAAELLLGSHDFLSFSNARREKSTVRTINSLNISEKDGLIEIEMNADSFLANMAKIMVGVLIEVGTGHLIANDIEKMFYEKKRWEAGPIAQAKGLCLRDVQY